MSTGSRDEEPNRVFPHGHAAAHVDVATNTREEA